MCLTLQKSWKQHQHQHHHSHPHEYLTARETSADLDICKGWHCGPGRECKVRPVDLTPECGCIQECFDDPEQVCGSDGQTYRSECGLHRTACLLKDRQLEVDYVGACSSKPETRHKSLPVHSARSHREDRKKEKLDNHLKHQQHHHQHHQQSKKNKFDEI